MECTSSKLFSIHPNYIKLYASPFKRERLGSQEDKYLSHRIKQIFIKNKEILEKKENLCINTGPFNESD